RHDDTSLPRLFFRYTNTIMSRSLSYAIVKLTLVLRDPH
ncbi:hypothetical protein CSUI_004412, partial [Cystoisospora suis]